MVPYAALRVGHGKRTGSGDPVPQPQDSDVPGLIGSDRYPALDLGTLVAPVDAVGVTGQWQIDRDLGPGLNRVLPAPVQRVRHHMGAGQHQIRSNEEACAADRPFRPLDPDDRRDQCRLRLLGLPLLNPRH